MNGHKPLSPLILALGLLLSWPVSAGLPSDEMLHTIIRLEAPDLPPTHFGAQPKSVWRVGVRFLRLEERPNPETGLHMLFIARAPDTWMIDRRTRRAKHVLDPGPSIDVHMPVIVPARGQLQKLEFGNELEFFREHGAKPGRSELRRGVAVQDWPLNLEGHKLLLTTGPGDRPLRLRVQTPDGRTFTFIYDHYERSRKIDLRLFDLPAGLTIEEATPAPATSPGK